MYFYFFLLFQNSYGDPEVCGESDADVMGGACSGAVSFEAARALCQHGGARLCTSDELLADEAKGTGCNYDQALVWSGTSCGVVHGGGDGGARPWKEQTFWAVVGSTNAPSYDAADAAFDPYGAPDDPTAHAQCLHASESTTAVVVARCCADQSGCTASPTPRPTSRAEGTWRDYGWLKGYPTPRPTATYAPSHAPTPVPTHIPTHLPTGRPTKEPSPAPTPEGSPTVSPTRPPTKEPSPLPSPAPTRTPTRDPTPAPTPEPSSRPTHPPSHLPTPHPTVQPTPPPTHVLAVPTPQPSPDPSRAPTSWPTHAPSRVPTPAPSESPKTLPPSFAPTHPPTPAPSHLPTTQTVLPTHIPTSLPSLEPTPLPTLPPSIVPTPLPSALPTEQPTKRSLCSERTCAELGWDPLAVGAHSMVCGGSEALAMGSYEDTTMTTTTTLAEAATKENCYGGDPTYVDGYRTNGRATFFEARAFCQSAGARLCEDYELLGDDARDSGCHLNGELVWSATPCAHNQRNYYVTYGSTDGDRLNGALQGDDDGPNGPKAHNKLAFASVEAGGKGDHRQCTWRGGGGVTLQHHPLIIEQLGVLFSVVVFSSPFFCLTFHLNE